MMLSIGQVGVYQERDVILVRQFTREIASLAGLSVQDETRLVTGVSEILRNAFQYAGGARVDIRIIEQDNKQYLQVVICDQGPGIANIEEILGGRYRSKTGMGRGIIGTRKLVDLFSIESGEGQGTSVILGKEIAEGKERITATATDEWAKALGRLATSDRTQEISEQNKQLLSTLEKTQNYKLELQRQLLQVEQLNKDLEQTNAVLLTLYKEIDESRSELLKKTELLEQQRQQLQDATRHKSEFLATMSHEIRTPMNAVIGMTEIILRSGLTAEQRRYANTIREGARSLLAVINDILDFSKIEAGKLSLEVIDFEPAMLVEDIAELLGPQATKRSLTLLTFIDPEIPLVLRGDPVRLRQILMNFVGNAIKFSEQGSILIRTILESQDSQFARIKFSVDDQGIGMTEQERNRVFEPFVQAESSTSRKYGGTGLGLSISKHLVELMGGTLGINSVKGHGSSFWFTIPLEIGSSKSVKQLAPTSLAGLRVLIVDDDAAVCEIVHTYLISWGLRLSIAKDGKEGLSALRANAKSDPYDFAIIDLVMPGMNGVELGKAIREDDDLKNTKLILATAFEKSGADEEAILLNFDASLTKPIRQTQLLNAIATVVYESQRDKTKPLNEQNHDVIHASLESPIARPELILVAEDHPINQEVALLLLRGLGFEAHVAENGQQAVEIVKRTSYSLIFMDCQMPEMDGFEATRSIRNLEIQSSKNVPIVAMTADAVEGSREQCLTAGMDDYISKPIDPDVLKVILERWLPASQQAGASSVPLVTHEDSFSASTPMDIPSLRKRFDANVAKLLVGMFKTDTPQTLDQIGTAIVQRNFDKVAELAHYLKGASGTVYATKIEKLCSQLETMSNQGDTLGVRTIYEKLQTAFQEAQEYVSNTLDEII